MSHDSVNVIISTQYVASWNLLILIRRNVNDDVRTKYEGVEFLDRGNELELYFQQLDVAQNLKKVVFVSIPFSGRNQ